jgi:hypothetical protein
MSLELDLVVGLEVPTGKFSASTRAAGTAALPPDGGVVCWYEKPLGDDLIASLDLEPGIFTGIISESPNQKLGKVTLAKSGGGRWFGESKLAFGLFAPVAYSELRRDLASLRS